MGIKVVFTEEAVEGMLSTPELDKLLNLSDGNKSKLRRSRSVGAIRMASLGTICVTLRMEPGDLFEIVESKGETEEETTEQFENDPRSRASSIYAQRAFLRELWKK